MVFDRRIVGDDAGNGNLRVAVFTQRIRKRRLLVKQHPALKDAQSASAVQAGVTPLHGSSADAPAHDEGVPRPARGGSAGA